MAVKESILRNVKKHKNPFVRSISVCYTGFDICYGTERQAMKFVTQNIATMICQDLNRYGNFRVIEVDG